MATVQITHDRTIDEASNLSTDQLRYRIDILRNQAGFMAIGDRLGLDPFADLTPEESYLGIVAAMLVPVEQLPYALAALVSEGYDQVEIYAYDFTDGDAMAAEVEEMLARFNRTRGTSYELLY